MANRLSTIDAFLADVRHQSLIDGDKVRDFLLDLRLLLAADGEGDTIRYTIEFESE